MWLVLSNFSQFHQLLIENQVGVMTLEVLDLEIKRTEHRIKVILPLIDVTHTMYNSRACDWLAFSFPQQLG